MANNRCITRLLTRNHTIENKGSNSEASNQYLTDDRLDSIAKIVNDDARWQWSQGGGAGGGNNQDLRQRDNSNNDLQVTLQIFINIKHVNSCKYVNNFIEGRCKSTAK